MNGFRRINLLIVILSAKFLLDSATKSTAKTNSYPSDFKIMIKNYGLKEWIYFGTINKDLQQLAYYHNGYCVRILSYYSGLVRNCGLGFLITYDLDRINPSVIWFMNKQTSIAIEEAKTYYLDISSIDNFESDDKSTNLKMRFRNNFAIKFMDINLNSDGDDNIVLGLAFNIQAIDVMNFFYFTPNIKHFIFDFRSIILGLIQGYANDGIFKSLPCPSHGISETGACFEYIFTLDPDAGTLKINLRNKPFYDLVFGMTYSFIDEKNKTVIDHVLTPPIKQTNFVKIKKCGREFIEWSFSNKKIEKFYLKFEINVKRSDEFRMERWVAACERVNYLWDNSSVCTNKKDSNYNVLYNKINLNHNYTLIRLTFKLETDLENPNPHFIEHHYCDINSFIEKSKIMRLFERLDKSTLLDPQFISHYHLFNSSLLNPNIKLEDKLEEYCRHKMDFGSNMMILFCFLVLPFLFIPKLTIYFMKRFYQSIYEELIW